jgi:hypothetical protein
MARHTAQDFTLEQAIGALKSSPMFQLSLASKELFHSNFLAWLCESYPQEAGGIFAKFMEVPPTSYDRIRARREWKKIDLWLGFYNGEELIRELVIENKVKDLPNRPQLERMARIARKHCGEGPNFLLLSLSPFNFVLGEWRDLSYATLLVKLDKIRLKIGSQNCYHGELLQDYIKFIFYLEFLARCFNIDWVDNESDFFEADDDVEQLKKIRLHDLVLKRRYSELTSQIAESLRKNGFEVVEKNAEKPKTRRDFRPGEAFVESEFIKGHAFCQFRYILTGDSSDCPPVTLGVAVQGHDFRLYIGVRDHKAPTADLVALKLLKPGTGKKGWFDFRLVQDYSDLLERPNKRGDRTFGKFDTYGTRYRYTKLTKKISPAQLVEVFVSYADWIRANERALREQVTT